MTVPALIRNPSGPGLQEKSDLTDLIQSWFPVQRTLSFNQIIAANRSVVMQGPLTIPNGYTLTIANGGVLRILT
jgi:hypothetical protein